MRSPCDANNDKDDNVLLSDDDGVRIDQQKFLSGFRTYLERIISRSDTTTEMFPMPVYALINC
jgi:hypothetical protein